jgi:hypothetical protein
MGGDSPAYLGQSRNPLMDPSCTFARHGADLPVVDHELGATTAPFP